MKNLKIVIAGGSGYIGKSITNFLSEKGFYVSWLTRKINTNEKVNQFESDFTSLITLSNSSEIIFVLTSFGGIISPV